MLGPSIQDHARKVELIKRLGISNYIKVLSVCCNINSRVLPGFKRDTGEFIYYLVHKYIGGTSKG